MDIFAVPFKKCSMCSLLRLNAIHTHRYNEHRNPTHKDPTSPSLFLFSTVLKTSKSKKCQKLKWLINARKFWKDGTNHKFLLLQVSEEVAAESSCRIGYVLLRGKERLESAGSQVFVKFKKSTLVTLTRLVTKVCLFSIMCRNMSSDFGPLGQTYFSEKCISHVPGFANT